MPDFDVERIQSIVDHREAEVCELLWALEEKCRIMRERMVNNPNAPSYSLYHIDVRNAYDKYVQAITIREAAKQILNPPI